MGKEENNSVFKGGLHKLKTSRGGRGLGCLCRLVSSIVVPHWGMVDGGEWYGIIPES